jgi:hypothetical protein
MSPLSTFLFSRPSFIEGMCRVVDIAGTLNEYNRSETGEMADYLALYADWRLIGMDIQRAMLEARSSAVEGNRVVEQTR